ncbi:hypothetical protein GCM10011511_46430 [Puia dinghuensis]|uniref:TIGR03118 family protein n=2 Tax=Puia dinghuensis TaxID=1792502 RepID=A0A8J2UHE2_9BACT|nr:hypothetical protein GCM10011511_46430 [Puia dinghuensis]
MRLPSIQRRWPLLACLLLATACHKLIFINNHHLRSFQQVNLVANKSSYGAGLTDSTLQNAWGLAWSPSGIAWVNSQAGHVSELYTADGAIVRPPVAIPSPGDTIGGNPTGIVFNSTKGFRIANGKPAAFIFVGLDGVLSAWNGGSGNNAQKIGHDSTSVFTGLAIDSNAAGQTFIYAADILSGKIVVWDTAWKPVAMTFTDGSLPMGYAPYNIQSVGGWLYVTYAKVKAGGFPVFGVGLGIVDIFKGDGSFVKRFATGGDLNAPWGITMTPANFLASADMGNDEGDDEGHNNQGDDNDQGNGNLNEPVILVGNLGDGRINVFLQNGTFKGQLQSNKKTIVIDGLWALGFPPTTDTAVNHMRLYFTAGPVNQADGLFGYLLKQ